MTDIPILNDAERQELERLAGRSLSNEEAQLFRREKLLVAAFQDWLDARNITLLRRIHGS